MASKPLSDIRKTLAIIVNYRSARWTLGAVRSVLNSDSITDLHVVVVDNSENALEASFLRSNLPRQVTTLINFRNIGFARACNQAFQAYDSDLVLLLNPDARLLPGTLTELQRVLSTSPESAAAGPHAFWDDECRYRISPSLPLFSFFWGPELHGWGKSDIVNRWIGAWWRQFALRSFRYKKPIKVKNLSGGHVLLKRDAVDAAGGLFDPRFFLYFEDTDLFVRLRKRGYRLVLVPYVHCVHHYDQCGRDNLGQKRKYMEISMEYFLGKHGRKTDNIKRFIRFIKPKTTPLHFQSEMPSFTSPFTIRVPRLLRKQWVFELSPNWNFMPAVYRFGQGEKMAFSDACWDLLAPGDYHARLARAKDWNYHTEYRYRVLR